MPLYEYKCNSCGDVFELIQKFADEPLTTHEKCGGAVERLVSAPALQFKGTGWYITDYARGGNGGEKKEKADKASDSTKSETAKSEATKSESAKSESAKSSSEPAAPAAKTSSDK